MIAIARTPPAFDRRHVLHLGVALIVGIAIGSAAGAGLTDARPAEAESRALTVPAAQAPAAATDGATTTASEQYRAPYTSVPEPVASTTASEEYRAAYTGEE